MQRRSISLKSVSFSRPAVNSPTASNADVIVQINVGLVPPFAASGNGPVGV